jgi:hypothetical protein
MSKSLLFALAILAGGDAVAVQQVSEVPSGFHGYWEPDINLCGTARGDGRLTVSQNELHFHESIGPVKAVLIESPRDAIVIAQLRGEGESWLAQHHFRLSEDLNTLTLVLERGNVIRHRCPGKSPY